MQEELDKVRKFMEVRSHSTGAKLLTSRNVHLETAVQTIAVVAAVLETHVHEGDLRVLRAHLLCEELSETLSALCEGGRLNLLDGLADLSYVTLGTAIAFGLPLGEAFDRVHASNMTKQISPLDLDPRVRVKGEGYRPPDLRGL